MSKIVSPLALSLGLTIAQAACGGSETNACSEVAPCGGDVTGTWTIVDSCVSNFVSNIPTGLVCTSSLDMAVGIGEANSSESWTGGWVFTKAMTYSSALVVTDTESFRCADTDVACSMRDAAIKSAAAADSSIIDAHCIGSDTDCICSDTKVSVASSTGTYSYAGNGYQLTFDPNPVFGFNYCVRGGMLHWINNGAFDQMSPPGFIPDIVLRRKSSGVGRPTE